MIRYEYQCSYCEQTFHDYARMEDRNEPRPCKFCGGESYKIIGAPTLPADIMSDKWLKNRESHMKVEQKNMKNHGTYK